ncbi:MAG: hypothetical protein IT288_01515 [Bdellovibrionales bacterium]|nr:hypothetical protein [Bdellovibrionales bacterium]
MKRTAAIGSIALLIVIFAVVFQSCRPVSQVVGGSTTGNPMSSDVEVTLKGFDVDGDPLVQKLDESPVTGSQTFATSRFELWICVHTLAFKHYYTRNPDIYDPERATGIEFIGPIEVKSQGTSLGRFDLADGEYNQIEMGLTQRYDWTPCGYSLKVVNDHGEFTSGESLNLVYQGTYRIDNSVQLIELPTQSLASAMAEVNADEDACEEDPSRSDCQACQADPQGPTCLTIERLIVERGLGWVYGR